MHHIHLTISGKHIRMRKVAHLPVFYVFIEEQKMEFALRDEQIMHIKGEIEPGMILLLQQKIAQYFLPLSRKSNRKD
jgi:hypothetical protein